MLRPATDHDVPAMLRWRNHPAVRAASFTTHEIGEAEHARWWAGLRGDPARLVLIYRHRGETDAGVVTFSGLTPGATSAEWGYYIDLAGLERAGETLRAWGGVERCAIAYAFGPLGLTTLRGQVLASNEPVRLLHRRFGFAEVGTHRREVGGALVDVVTVELTGKGDR
ncbi:GNAT family N-acetyltransferase [Nonomuraea lactucae]|uniref:GNAT family N-acetyltransferase n=1 Tax=Nonomuraea lactucae TaxID=2249762 RepID=UPI000DE50324|nr:GNAT family N-acetyltransferase [Nonomuraea lactucae]